MLHLFRIRVGANLCGPMISNTYDLQRIRVSKIRLPTISDGLQQVCLNFNDLQNSIQIIGQSFKFLSLSLAMVRHNIR